MNLLSFFTVTYTIDFLSDVGVMPVLPVKSLCSAILPYDSPHSPSLNNLIFVQSP